MPPPETEAVFMSQVDLLSISLLESAMKTPAPTGAMLWSKPLLQTDMELAENKATPPPTMLVAVFELQVLEYTMESLESE
mmetsp:Transcript_22741/g.53966  ORF Transcript_22741/g.53966 Transcript_22741/m.53966 type:complete len:80 (-) Transcript_22741:137-376(-)